MAPDQPKLPLEGLLDISDLGDGELKRRLIQRGVDEDVAFALVKERDNPAEMTMIRRMLSR